jgi:hypothetical protein
MSADQLLAHVTTDEPAMTLTAERLLRLGRRGHRRRLLGAIGGGGGALAVALGVFLAQLPGTPAPQVDTPQAVCLREVPIDATAPGDVTTDPANDSLHPSQSSANARARTKVAEPVAPTEAQLTTMSCAAVHTTLGFLPGRTFFPHGYRGQAAFQAIWFADGQMTLAQGRAVGGGTVSVAVSAQLSDQPPPTQDQLRTDEPWKSMDHVQLNNLPNGMVVLSYTDQLPLGGAAPVDQNVVTVWTGHTVVNATSDNSRSVRPADAGGPPLLNLDQLRQLALNADFALYG